MFLDIIYFDQAQNHDRAKICFEFSFRTKTKECCELFLALSRSPACLLTWLKRKGKSFPCYLCFHYYSYIVLIAIFNMAVISPLLVLFLKGSNHKHFSFVCCLTWHLAFNWLRTTCFTERLLSTHYVQAQSICYCFIF